MSFSTDFPMLSRRSLLLTALASPAATVFAAEAKSEEWSQWRGPNGAGIGERQKPPIEWSRTKNLAWSTKLPGVGFSSPVVYRGRIYLTTQADDAGRRSLLTLCYDLATGEERWRHDFGYGFNQGYHQKSNLAAPTPAVASDGVYVSFANAEFAKYTHDGKLLWTNRLVPQFGDPKTSWGWGASPLLLPESVVFAWDHHAGPCYLLGLDRQTGKIAWKVDRPIGTSHSTPLVVTHHGQTDLLVPGKHRMTAFDRDSHKQLWVYGDGAGPYNGEIIVSPVYGDGVVYTQIWRRSAIHALRLRGGGQAPEVLWVSDKPGPQESSLLYYRGHLYVWLDNGVLVCYEGKSGVERYRERLGGECNASPVGADGRVYVSNNAGQTFVIAAGPAFKLLATNELGERHSASPALIGNEMLLRTDSTLWCMGR